MDALIKACGEYGIAVAALLSLVFVVHLFVGMIKNHIEHNTIANQELRDAIKELLLYLKENSKELQRSIEFRMRGE